MTHVLRLHRLPVFVALSALALGACAVDKGALLAPTDAVIVLVPASPVVAINQSTSITVQATKADGSPVADGTEILLSASRGELESSKVRTTDGQATVGYRAAPDPGLVQLGATSDQADTLGVLAIVSAPVGRVELTVTPVLLPFGGGQVELRATVRSDSGAPVLGAPVTFHPSTGSVLPATPVLSDEQGRATARLSASKASAVRAKVHLIESSEVRVDTEGAINLALVAQPSRAIVGQSVTFTVTPSDLKRSGEMTLIFGDGQVQNLGLGSGVRSFRYSYSESGGFNVTAVFVSVFGTEVRQTIRFNVDTGIVPLPPGGGGGIIDDPTLPFSLGEVAWLHTNVSKWAVTSEILSVNINSSDICINHTKAGKWPAPGGRVEGNPWVFAKIDGRWYAATYEWLRPGQICKSITSRTIGGHTDKHPLETWRPRGGELVGFMVSALARAGQDTVAERSNIVMKRWP